MESMIHHSHRQVWVFDELELVRTHIDGQWHVPRCSPEYFSSCTRRVHSSIQELGVSDATASAVSPENYNLRFQHIYPTSEFAELLRNMQNLTFRA